MNTTPPNQQHEKEQKLLLRLLLAPVKRQSRIIILLSRPYWDGVGAVLGFLSLLVTIILTIYIFNLTTEQGIAHMNYSQSVAYGERIISVPQEGPVYSISSQFGSALIIGSGRFAERFDIPQGVVQRLDGTVPRLEHIITTINYGSATAQGVSVIISSEDEITCKMQETSITSQTVSPTRITQAENSCKLYYDYFYPRKSSSIIVVYSGKISEEDSMGLIILPDVDISGVNVAVP